MNHNSNLKKKKRFYVEGKEKKFISENLFMIILLIFKYHTKEMKNLWRHNLHVAHLVAIAWL